MKRSSVLLMSIGVAVITAAPAGAAIAPPPTAYTAGQLVPVALSTAAEYVYGSHYAKQVEPGTTALVWDLALVAGQTIDLTMQCPAGQVMVDLNVTGPGSASGETTPLPVFTPWYGQNAPSVTLTATKSGPLVWAVLCLPTATTTSTTIRGRSPVTFAAGPEGTGATKGRKLPKGATVLKLVTTSAVNAGGTFLPGGRGCPSGTFASNAIVTQGASGGTGAANGLILYPSTVLGSGPVTVYQLCAPPPKG